MEELLAVFQSLDTDATGSLSAKEVGRPETLPLILLNLC